MNNHKKSQKHKGPLEGAAALGLGQPYTLSLDHTLQKDEDEAQRPSERHRRGA